jgi:uncharacterized membrane protein
MTEGRGLGLRIRDEFATHRSFHVALVCGVVVWLATTGRHPALRVLLSADVFFLVFIGLMMRLAFTLDTEGLRCRAAVRLRTGIGVVAILTLIAMVLSLWAIFLLLNHPQSEGRMFPILAVLSVPLSWMMTHTLAAYQYASLYYAPGPDGEPRGGMTFAGSDQPDGLDFLYQAFVIGASASVSDVAASSRPMRRAVMVHSLAAFAYNTVLIAIAVNAALIVAR